MTATTPVEGSRNPRPDGLPFKAVLEQAAGDVRVIAARWLPQGKPVGNWWVACTPWRDDKRPSLGLSLTTAHWREFTTGERGDLVDLYQKMKGGSRVDALKVIARLVGHPFGNR